LKYNASAQYWCPILDDKIHNFFNLFVVFLIELSRNSYYYFISIL
jgi:hypothetical protein